MLIINYLLFWFLLLISLLPMPFLYFFGKGLYVLLFYVLRYRKRIIYKNLSGSLPPTIDIHKTAKEFYRFLAEMVVETIKLLTISEKQLLKRIQCENPEIMEQFAKEGRSVIFLSAHYGNWEVFIYAMNLLFPHLAIGVGKPLSNQVLNVLINNKRSKFGMKIIHAKNIKEEFARDKNRLTASLFLADQYPGGVQKGYKTIFLNKETEFLYGAEKYAREYDYPVVYGDISRIGRGKYSLRIITVTDKPNDVPYGFIMDTYVQLLTQTIYRDPSYWLWSHKRWKNLPEFYKP